MLHILQRFMFDTGTYEKWIISMFEKKHVAILSGISGIATLVAGIGIAVAWSYWSDTLDACPESSCSCIFYAHLRGLTFSGGSPIWCRVLTYFTLAAAIFSIVVAVYYFMKLRAEPKDYNDRSSSPNTNARLNNRLVLKPTSLILKVKLL